MTPSRRPKTSKVPPGELVLAEEGGVRVFYISPTMADVVDRLALVDEVMVRAAVPSACFAVERAQRRPQRQVIQRNHGSRRCVQRR